MATPQYIQLALDGLRMTRGRCAVWVGILVALLAVVSHALALSAPLELPPVFLWAWERKEDLRFIDPRETGVAFLAATIRIAGSQVTITRRRQPLRVPLATSLLAVAHVAAGAPTDQALSRTVDALLECSQIPGVVGVQLDFEATPSQRPFYEQLVRQVRTRLPPGQILSATALTSWCLFERWLDALPLDEVVPMLFSMGRGDAEVRGRLAAGEDFPPAYCRQSVGVSMQEPFPPLLHTRRVYAFNARAWTPDDYRRLLAARAREGPR